MLLVLGEVEGASSGLAAFRLDALEGVIEDEEASDLCEGDGPSALKRVDVAEEGVAHSEGGRRLRGEQEFGEVERAVDVEVAEGGPSEGDLSAVGAFEDRGGGVSQVHLREARVGDVNGGVEDVDGVLRGVGESGAGYLQGGRREVEVDIGCALGGGVLCEEGVADGPLEEVVGVDGSAPLESVEASEGGARNEETGEASNEDRSSESSAVVLEERALDGNCVLREVFDEASL